MKVINYLRNFISNTYSLTKTLLKNRQVQWQNISCHVINCRIDRQAKLWGNYKLLNVSINKGTYLAGNADISNTTIGKFCSIGPNLVCGRGIHPLNGISTSPIFYSTKGQVGYTYSRIDKYTENADIRIGNDVFIGANVTILDGVKIGDGAVIGAGAVVSKNIPPYAIAVGVPIKVINYRFEPEIIKSLLELNWWDQNDVVLKEVEKRIFEVDEFLTWSKEQKK